MISSPPEVRAPGRGVTFYRPNSPHPWFDRPVRAAAASPGQAPMSLNLGMDLSQVLNEDAKVAFEIMGLPDPAEPTAAFTIPFALGGAGAFTITKVAKADQATIDAQKVCKVNGEGLGSIGVPIKVTRGNCSVFLCCQGCVKSIRANPDRYLSPAR